MRTVLYALLALGLASPALAQKRPDSGKDALETGESKAKDVVRPDEAKETVRPEDSEVEKFVAEKEARLSKVRQKQIEDMRKILKKNPLYKRKADLLFRIAEKEREEAKYNYFLSRKKYDAQMDAFYNEKLKKKPEEPVPDYSKALVEYKKLLKEFPNYKRIDEVMFYLGRGLISAEKNKEGASYMLRLTKEHPKSKFVSRAYLAVAEYYFENDLLFAAKTNYLEVLKDEKSSEYPYALYKLGYVYYNLREYEDSIKSFHRVVDLAKSKDKRGVYFKNQAFSAVTLAYAEVDDGWKRARDYFRKAADEKMATERLEAIARIYNKQDKTPQEVEVYEYLISANKEGPKVPEYAEYITKAAKKQEDLEKTEVVVNRFLTYFDPKGSWHTVNKEKEEPMTRAGQYREEQTDWLIGQYHTKAQELEKLKQAEKANRYYGNAAKYYEKYLAWFPKSKDLYEKEFFLAEIYYFQMQKWDLAAEHYAGVVKQDPKGKYSKESAYAVILCKEEKMADEGLIERPKRNATKKGKRKGTAGKPTVEYTKREKDDKFEPIPQTPLVASEKEFLQACTDYLDLFPKDEEVPAVAFRAAEIFIKKGHYGEGIKRLEVIMEHHSKHRFAGFAAATLFDSNYRLRRWDQMERWGRYMLDRKNFKVLNKKQLLDVIAISINEYATELNKKGEKEKAVEQWLRFTKEFPKHDKAGIALFNAAATTEGLEKTEQAIDLYESLIKRYPKIPQATEAHFVLGALYESQTDFETAANYFEKMAAFPDHEKQADSLYNAGAIRSALEQNDKAVEIFTTYVSKFPERDDTHEIQLEIAKLELKQNNYSAAQKAYDAYLKKFGKKRPESVVKVHLAKAQAFQKEDGKNARKLASAQLGLALKAYKRLPDAAKSNDTKAGKLVRRDAAMARFLEAEYVYDDFEAVKVSFPDRVLRKTLVKKAELLEKANKIYFDVLEYKAHDVSAGALYRIGESYYLFAKSLFDLPIPKELNEDEQFVYRAELDDRAAPLQEKAIEAMGRALELAHKNKVYNEWSRRSAALLVKLSPEAFPVLDDATNNTTWQVPSTFSTTYIKTADGKLESMLRREAEAKAKAEAEAKAKAEAEAKAKAAAEAAKAAKDGKAAPADDKAGDKKAGDKAEKKKKGAK